MARDATPTQDKAGQPAKSPPHITAARRLGMVARVYIVQGDVMAAIFDALPPEMIDGRKPCMVARTGCALRLESERDRAAFRLWSPDALVSLSFDDDTLVLNDDPAAVYPLLLPTLDQSGTLARAQIIEFAELYLPNHTDHDRLLAAMHDGGWNATT
ncbi:hypothetical protein [Rhodobacter capsulatus]|uniref:hypothetical protein n=1 Tax=Rhodobacter capsulatus TaxID=1061 RepID=UPI0003D31D9F|nr:hypothetical protein [Rhodobacter capsulatus]ETD84976.1 hypothetical protein U716_05935 [Rhodobacter capsulatus B6]